MSNTASPTIEQHFAPVFAKFGYVYRDVLGLATFTKPVDTALGLRDASFSVQVCNARSWEKKDLVIQANYLSEGENVLGTLMTILPNVVPANTEEIVSRLVSRADAIIRVTFGVRLLAVA